MSVHNTFQEGVENKINKEGVGMEEDSQDVHDLQEGTLLEIQRDRENVEDEDYNINVTVVAKECDSSPKQTKLLRNTATKGKARVPFISQKKE